MRWKELYQVQVPQCGVWPGFMWHNRAARPVWAKRHDIVTKWINLGKLSNGCQCICGQCNREKRGHEHTWVSERCLRDRGCRWEFYHLCGLLAEWHHHKAVSRVRRAIVKASRARCSVTVTCMWRISVGGSPGDRGWCECHVVAYVGVRWTRNELTLTHWQC